MCARHQHHAFFTITFQVSSKTNGDWCEFEANVTFCGLPNADILFQASSSIIAQQNKVLATRFPQVGSMSLAALDTHNEWNSDVDLHGL